ncbi:MAG: hypothetical protein A2015_14305 [Spirochaetes bacterium GWF1_31_7]|nr:MAG: hypothetical protein A2Y30_03445 [Spirochaetes bacterium GWE1_32_154]OHD45450.1 MAG: hypothetical protein A2Y29_01375 [Spirochaetes bacterium GWE2_31_10]OHD50573.1 MAG: hypothetical protein A2015_14305 [Spirochaetes bacterium GWF1_31_7]OHD81551.1 MAG: hypothetical protein A2355_02375 [Spirochaetes bacterium RIFOXYB1_FULL_32_8]HBD94573.1 hypothetical protein [Spirochaetia bacterium]
MKIFRFVFLFVFLIVFSCTNDFDVATYNGGSVSLSDLLKINSILSDTEKENLKTRDDCYKFIRKIALEKIILDEAAKTGLDKEPKIIDKITGIKQSVAFDLLRDKNVISKVKVVASDYEKYSNIYEVYQIVRRTDTLDDNKVAKSSKILTDISSKIHSLDDFKKYAQQYSEDVTSSEGGFLGKIRYGIMDDEIDKVLSLMKPKSLSSIVESYAGIHLLWVESIEKANMTDLLNDRKLYDLIYTNKVASIESEWFEKLLKSPGLVIDYENLNSKEDSAVIVEYKDKKITVNDFSARISDLRQGVFPYPTDSEKKTLLNDLAVKLVIEEKMFDTSFLDSTDFKSKFTIKADYFIINEFVERNKKLKEITQQDINDFYKENQQSLFSFKLENGKTFIQPINEVEKFIRQKLDSVRDKDSRYELYRNLVADYQLTISDDGINLFMKKK